MHHNTMQLTIREAVVQSTSARSTTISPRPLWAEDVSVIFTSLLIPGRGEPITNGAVAINSETIEWVGPAGDLPAAYLGAARTSVPVLMPGLWDCHVHYIGSSSAGEDQLVSLLPGAPVLGGAITTLDLHRTLMAGYTTVRELAGYGCDIWPGVKSGDIVGPNIYSSCAAISITGGHGDLQRVPTYAVKTALACCSAPLAVCDGVEDCIRTVRSVVRRGARVIKVCTSGGVLSPDDDPEDRQFSDEELAAIVREAACSRRAVAAHAIGKAGIMAALRAGAKSIEHGMYLDDEVADAMIAHDAIFVGTQHIVRTLNRPDYIDTIPEPSRSKVIKVGAQAKKSYALAIKRGVKIALGTDMLSSDPKSALSHGNNGHELSYAVELGMTPLRAIESATAIAPETLGGLAPKSGQLKAGYDADFIAVACNPLQDIGILANPDNVTHVWKGGKLFKSPK